MPSETSDLSGEKGRDKAYRVFDYLSDLVQLRSLFVRDLVHYPKVVWFDRIPETEAGYSAARGSGEEGHSGLWLRLQRFTEPPCPVLPEICREWITPSELLECDAQPQLKLRRRTLQAGFSRPGIGKSSTAGQFQMEPEAPQNYPDVESSWSSYLETRWKPWAKHHRRWKAVENGYTELFHIHQGLRRLGEYYELVVGFGYLTWAKESEAIRRHLLSARATLEFDSETSTFEVTAGVDGAQMRLETDMLYIDEKPPPERQKQIEDQLHAKADLPWNKSVVVSVLQSWLAAIGDETRVDAALTPVREPTSAPQISFAPALILRRRGNKELLMALDRVKSAIQERRHQLPGAVARFVSSPSSHTGKEASELPGTGDAETNQHRIYFPLSCNAQQRQVVESLQQGAGVLVQGPPGTGKSQTIANLVCHLAARGQRVLVTAQTSRSLKVLPRRLPKEILPLYFSDPSNDPAGLRDLKRKIQEIGGNLVDWNSEQNCQEIDRLESVLAEQEGRLQSLEAELKSAREQGSRVYEVADNLYQGTSQQIAFRLATEKDELGWLPDTLSPEDSLPLEPADFRDLRKSLVSIGADRLAELQQGFPRLAQLAKVEDFRSLVQEEKKARSILEKEWKAQVGPHFPILLNASNEDVTRLVNSIKTLRVVTENIKRRPLPWVEVALEGVLTDQDRPWRNIRKLTVEGLEELEQSRMPVDRVSIMKPASVLEDQLLADACDLKEHLDAGKRLGWWLFSPKVVRRTRYIPELVKVNGRRCDHQESLCDLIGALEIRQGVERLWSIWQGRVQRVHGSLAIQVTELQEHLEGLDELLKIQDTLNAAREACRAIDGLGEPHWQDLESLDEIFHSYGAVVAHRMLQEVQRWFRIMAEEISRLLGEPNPHPVAAELLNSIHFRDVAKYRACLQVLQKLTADADEVGRRAERLEKLRQAAPALSVELLQNPEDPAWDRRLRTIGAAWNWTRASTWLQEFLLPTKEADLQVEIRDVAGKIQQLTAQVSAARAWQEFFERLTDDQRQGWLTLHQSTQRLTNDERNSSQLDRRTLEQLERVRSSFPVLIAPLPWVFETIAPLPEMFDVVIVDDASQCGPEALLLLYMAKKVVIFGDEQQIGPDPLGVEHEDIDFLLRHHFSDFEQTDPFIATRSLMDYGEALYPHRVVFTEHFRCVPEIIRFSNDSSYSRNPLRPLRAYGPRRLKPVVTQSVQRNRGSADQSLHRLEAKAVARAVQACCKDPNYEGKSMGVISLRGTAQARLIEELLIEQVGATEMAKRDIVCSDPYGFQGDERDLMFLGMAASTDGTAGSLSDESERRRLNVAASRARDQMWLFHSGVTDRSPSGWRGQLLHYCLHPRAEQEFTGLNVDELRRASRTSQRQKVQQQPPFETWLQVDVFLEIVKRGYRVIPQFRVSNYRLDLAIEGLKSRLIVECSDDKLQSRADYEHRREPEQTLERCGWKFFWIRGDEFYHDPEAVLSSLQKELELEAIQPLESFPGEKAVAEDYVPAVDFAFEETSLPLGREPEPGPAASETEAPQRAEVPEQPAKTLSPSVANEDSVLHEPSGPSVAPPALPSREEKQEEVVERATEVKPEVWFAMASWAKDNGALEASDRLTLVTIGYSKRDGQEINARIARRSMALSEELVLKGFDLSPHL